MVIFVVKKKKWITKALVRGLQVKKCTHILTFSLPNLFIIMGCYKWPLVPVSTQFWPWICWWHLLKYYLVLWMNGFYIISEYFEC